MSAVSSKLRHWRDDRNGDEGLTYWCQGCDAAHGVRIKGAGAWTWNGDVDRPVFGPSVLTTWDGSRNGQAVREVCHTFVGCNGAQPGEVIFLSDCTHALAGTVQPLPDLPGWMR